MGLYVVCEIGSSKLSCYVKRFKKNKLITQSNSLFVCVCGWLWYSQTALCVCFWVTQSNSLFDLTVHSPLSPEVSRTLEQVCQTRARSGPDQGQIRARPVVESTTFCLDRQRIQLLIVVCVCVCVCVMSMCANRFYPLLRVWIHPLASHSLFSFYSPFPSVGLKVRDECVCVCVCVSVCVRA